MSKKFAVVLSGCGVYDGTEIHEAVLTLLAIAENGGEFDFFAPDITQHHVINHQTGSEMSENRNVLIESARIARGKIMPLSYFDATKYDGLVFPGGFGVAKNLSNYAFNGAECEVNKEIITMVKSMVNCNKPIGALCIAPAILTKILGNIDVTIGKEPKTASAIEKMGGTHIPTEHGEAVVDLKHKIVTAPCYMLNSSLVDIANDARAVIKKMINLMQ